MPIEYILPFTELAQIRIEWNKCVRSTQIQRVVNSPVNFPYFARRVIQALQSVTQKYARSQRDTHSFDSFHDSTNNMRGCLEAVGPYKIHEMHHGIFTSETCDAESKMLDDCARCLSVNKITICQCVFQHGHNGIAVIGRLRPDVFENERQRLQTAGSNV